MVQIDVSELTAFKLWKLDTCMEIFLVTFILDNFDS